MTTARRVQRTPAWLHLVGAVTIAVGLGSIGCGGDDGDDGFGSDDAGVDAADDGGADSESDAATDTGADSVDDGASDTQGDAGPPEIPEPTGRYVDAKTGEADEVLVHEGLRYPVHVTRDSIGIVHILAESLEDAVWAQGYFHARDRFPQMEIFRLSTSGRLARLAGTLDDGIIEDDIFARMMGFARVGRASYEAMDPSSPSRRALDAYAAGVNAYIDELKSGEASLPGPHALLFEPANLQPWHPADGMSVVRFQQSSLGFTADEEVRNTEAWAAADEAFPSDSEDPRLAARSRIMLDLQRWTPSDPTFQFEGFPDDDKSGVVRPPAPPTVRPDVPRDALRVARRFLDRLRRSPVSRAMRERGFSNSWTVRPERSASGNALLANDPHLSLDSPTVFHQAHIVVEPRTDADGPATNAFGFIFPGLPGALIGHNEDVAWGLTTANFDYSDAFLETLTTLDDGRLAVMRDGEAVAVELHEETIEIGLFGNVNESFTVQIPWAPGRGPIAAEIEGREIVVPEEGQAVSFAWRGFSPSDEVAAVLGWMHAGDVEEFDAATESWTVGSQMLMVADTEGNIFNTGKSYLPQRPPEAMTWDPETNPDGTAPWWILDGTGPHDWLAEPIATDLMPHARNPDHGFLVNANNAQVDVGLDGNPLNDAVYIGHDWDLGFRAGRIDRALAGETELFPEGHAFTVDDLGRLQNDSYSNLGARLRPELLTHLDRIIEEMETPGSHESLTELLADSSMLERARALRSLLADWSLVADDGMSGAPDAGRIRDSGATTLYNLWATAIHQAVFRDELDAAPGLSVPSQYLARALVLIMEEPESAATFDAERGESVLWDDLETEDVVETRELVVARAFLEAVAEADEIFESEDPSDWRWGLLHHRIFDAQVPDASLLSGGVSEFRWPQPDEGFGEDRGFPQMGDSYNVNACSGGITNFDYECGGGPILRFLVELDPEGVRSFNASPGGQSIRPESPHFRDQLSLWLEGERAAIAFHPEDVAADVESHAVFLPPTE